MISVGLKNLSIDLALKAAGREILFLAPPYGNFKKSNQIYSALESVLSNSQGAFLTVLCLPDINTSPWVLHLMSLLRPAMSMQDMQHELNESRIFLHELFSKYPDRISILELREQPSLPTLIIDDHIYFSHFAHSSVMTPEGYWNLVEAPVEKLFEHVRAGTEPSDPVERAAFRIISECAYMLSKAVPIDLG